MKTLIIGDLHFKEKLGYDEYIKGGRDEEKQEILDFIIKQSKDCDKVVFLGDQFNAKNNISSVVKDFVNFIEKFGDKKLYFLPGNHEKMASGETALDFINEVTNKNWKVINNVYIEDNMVFCPYYYSSEFGTEDINIASVLLLERLRELNDKFPTPDKILFAHHATTNTKIGNYDTSFFHEILLTAKELEKIFKQTFLGHIHSSKQLGSILYTGSVFNNEVGETQKYIYKWDGESVEEIKLPGRKIYKLENPADEAFEKIEKDSIIKLIVSDKKYKVNKEIIDQFDAVIIKEQYEEERKIEEGRKIDILSVSLEELLDIYAKTKGIELKDLMRGLGLLNK